MGSSNGAKVGKVVGREVTFKVGASLGKLVGIAAGSAVAKVGTDTSMGLVVTFKEGDTILGNFNSTGAFVGIIDTAGACVNFSSGSEVDTTETFEVDAMGENIGADDAEGEDVGADISDSTVKLYRVAFASIV